MKTLIYSKRNFKELINDPISIIFIIGLPVFLLIFIVTLNKSINSNDAFKVNNFVPATIIFSFSFITMFSGMLIAKDRNSSFLSRMFVSPLKPKNYILGYMIPLFLLAIIQSIVLYIVGFIMGLNFNIHIFSSFFFLLLISTLFISIGLILGSLLKDQQVAPISSLLVQIVAFLSGMWFNLDLIGGIYEKIGYILPFSHSVDLVRHVLLGEYNKIFINLLFLVLYTTLFLIISIYTFKIRMKE